jgi:glyoxylase-like metal-dependent hydrolase (beta-lactamase superfamily II)
MSATIHHLAPHLFLIVLAPPIKGFQDFVGAWLVDGPDAVYLVDVGPAATADQLADALATLNVARLDYICLTHIHIDHAGAIGHLAKQYPNAAVVCHPKGAPHIVDPERLWQGTVKTLGDVGRAYGRMLPLSPARLATKRQLASAPFQLLDTPGHSPHHYAIAANGCLFAEKPAVSVCRCPRETATCARPPRHGFSWRPRWPALIDSRRPAPGHCATGTSACSQTA